MPMTPEDQNQRSFVSRKLGQAAAQDIDLAAALVVADLSLLSRTGYKGREALAWVAEQGLDFEVQANKAFEQPDGSLCAVLAPGEVVVLSPLMGSPETVSGLKKAWSAVGDQRVYEVLRDDVNFEFLIAGPRAAAMFAKLCGVNLASSVFAVLDIAQTSVARVNCIVLRSDVGGTLAYRILGDSASAEYMFDCLLDAMAEFDGTVVDLEAVLAASR